MFDKFRFRRTQPKTDNPKNPRFAPGWLSQQQRTTLRLLGTALFGSLALNGYQMKLREDIATAPPQVFAALYDSDMTTMRVVRADDLKSDEFEAAAKSEVRRLIYRLRRVDSADQVQEAIGLLSCNVTGTAAQKAARYIDRGPTMDMVKRNARRILNERGINAGRRPGESRSVEKMWMSATWTENLEDAARHSTSTPSGEFLVQRFNDVSPQIRDCNPLGIMITDYELFINE